MATAAKRKAKAKPATDPAPKMKLSIVDAMNDEALFASWYRGPSWDGWRAVLAGAFCQPMTEKEKEIFRDVAQRDPPKKQPKEIWIAGARRLGKGAVASLIAVHTAMTFDKQHLLRPGERALVLCLATDISQAKIILNYVRAFFSDIPMLQAMVTRETQLGFELSNGVDVEVSAANFRGVRGRAIALVVLDEVAFFSSDNSANPDLEIYRALLPGCATLDGMIVGISSPYRQVGLLYSKFKEHYGKDSEDVLFIKAATRKLNPTIAQSVIDKAYADDPIAAASEWGAEFRNDLAGWLNLETIEAAVDTDVMVRPPNTMAFTYSAFADSSGGVRDSYTLGIAHEEAGVAVLDCLVEVKAPFDPSVVTAQLAAVLKSYKCTEVSGDKYAANFVTESFAKHEIKYNHSKLNRSEIYMEALPLFNAGRIRLLDSSRVISQLAGLVRKASPSGRANVDHAPGSSDDCSNAACGALVLCSSQVKRTTLFFGSVETARSLPAYYGF
jgi:hypothetical protein